MLVAICRRHFALGAAIGAVTGVIVAKGRVQAFIATRVMMLLLRGVTMVYTNGSPVNTGFTDNADPFGWFGIGRPLRPGRRYGLWHRLSGGPAHAAPYAAPGRYMRWAVTRRRPAYPASASIK